MNEKERGYCFALPRLLARAAGLQARRAEFSRAEVYGFGILVFGFACVIAGRVLLPLVRPAILQAVVVLLLPLAVWAGFLLFYYLNFLLARALRHLGLYSARTNNPLQHFLIMSLMTLLAALLLRDSSVVMRSLAIFWISLVVLNLGALLVLKLLHER